MKRIHVLAAAVLAAACAAPAHAQIVSIYALSNNTHFSNVETGDVYTGGGYTEQYASFWAPGIGGGVTLNFLSAGPVRLGLDLRGSHGGSSSGNTGGDTGMLGLRVGAKVPFVHIKPYIQASGGYVQTHSLNVSTIVSNGTQATPSFVNKYAAYEIFGGIDIPLVHFVDLRAIEIGGGQGFGVPDIGTTNRNVTLFNVNTGIVLHF